MKHTRRDFLGLASTLGAAPLFSSVRPFERLLPHAGAQPRRVFLHGVASGDPLTDGVILWTRISRTAREARPAVRWEIARENCPPGTLRARYDQCQHELQRIAVLARGLSHELAEV